MEGKNHGSPSFINIAVLLLFAIVIAVVSAVTTYFVLNSRSNEQYSDAQPPITPPPKTYIQPTSLPVGTVQTVPDDTANWKMYRNSNNEVRFELKYPPTLGLIKERLNDDYLENISLSNNLLSVIIYVEPSEKLKNLFGCGNVSICNEYYYSPQGGFWGKRALITNNGRRAEFFTYLQFDARTYSQDRYLNDQIVDDLVKQGKISETDQDQVLLFNQILSTFKFLE